MVTVANGRYELPENLYYTSRHVYISKENLTIGLDELGYAFLKNPLQILFHVQPGENMTVDQEFVTFVTDQGMTSLNSPCEGTVKSINLEALNFMQNDTYGRGYLVNFKNIDAYTNDVINGDQLKSWATTEARNLLRGNLQIKVVMIGDSAVGKTALKVRFTDEYFKKDLISTLGVDFGSKVLYGEYYPTDILMQGTIKFKMNMSIWDAAGQAHYAQMRPMYYRNAQGALLVYDVTNQASFDHLPEWIEELENMTGPIPTILVGNKIDLDREVQKEDAEAFAKEHKFLYIETSAKYGDNVDNAFQRLGLEIFKRMFEDELD
ncbi:MAG TPA: Rab family GTPase [Candidatus Lokiarchaeia archaeon]|nr:Rab family GTPase [Candidatus Lokiarchaeia archaeon]